ncbi:MAG: glycine cleavage system protein H [Mycobacteriales bacterium]
MTLQVWRGCAFPDELLYDVELHVWVRPDGDELVLGMTDVAQSMGGRVVSVTWKKLGRLLTRGQAVAVVESAKWVGPFPTPVTGELRAVNRAAFEADTAIANRDPYGAGWLARVSPRQLAAERGHLVGGLEAYRRYREFLDERDLTCYRCES